MKREKSIWREIITLQKNLRPFSKKSPFLSFLSSDKKNWCFQKEGPFPGIWLFLEDRKNNFDTKNIDSSQIMLSKTQT